MATDAKSPTMFLKGFFDMKARDFLKEWGRLSDADKDELRAEAKKEMERQGIPIK